VTLRIGLSGGIGTGKSSVAQMWAALGAVIVDADAIVHELQAPGAPLLEAIRSEFGEEIFDASGALDRKALGRVVFNDPEARARLGRLVHPRVRQEMRERVGEATRAGAALVVLDIPLLFEGRASGAPRGRDAIEFDATVLVYAPRAVQIERTVARDACSVEEAEQRLSSQMSIEDKRKLADHVIDNSGTLEATRRSVEALHGRLVESS
jgi:dephospho-CoA kinase